MVKQKKRTILTIIGIVLSCALVCAIGIFLESVQHAFLLETEHSVGRHHYSLYLAEPTKENAEKLLEI